MLARHQKCAGRVYEALARQQKLLCKNITLSGSWDATSGYVEASNDCLEPHQVIFSSDLLRKHSMPQSLVSDQ